MLSYLAFITTFAGIYEMLTVNEHRAEQRDGQPHDEEGDAFLVEFAGAGKTGQSGADDKDVLRHVAENIEH